MTEPTKTPKLRSSRFAWLIVLQFLAVGALLIWVIVAGLSVMAFDEGQSPEAWAFVLAIWAYPLFPLLMAIGAWVAFVFRKNRIAAVLSELTFVTPVLLLLIVWVANSSVL